MYEILAQLSRIEFFVVCLLLIRLLIIRLFTPLVRLYDLLDQLVSDDILFVKLDRGDPFDAPQYPHCVDESRLLGKG